MIRTSINKLKDYLRQSSSLLGSPDFMLLLDTSAPEGLSGDHVFLRILKLALNEYEKHNPWFLYTSISDNEVTESVYKFTDNFAKYLAGDIDESDIQLVPTTVINVSGSWIYQYRDYVYHAPYLTMSGYPYVDSIYYATRRPVLYAMDITGKSITDDSFIYGIDIDGRAADRWFLKYLEYEVLIYLRDQKSNLMYPDMPIDFLSGLQERLAEVMQTIESYKQSPFKAAELLR